MEALRAAADVVQEGNQEAWATPVMQVIDFLKHELMPHALQEEEDLYPEVARLMRSPDATRTMTRDHVEVDELTKQLARAMEESDFRMVRRLLYGLYHVIRLHFAKEEEIYLPLLRPR